jgi:hypothetical protein
VYSKEQIMAESRDFTLILVKGDPGPGAGSLARVFGLTTDVAQQLCKSSPVVLADGLTKSDVKEYSPKLADLSKAGTLEFRITARATHGLPKVHWEGGQPFSGDAGFEMNNSAFVCPCCGEGFLFQRSSFKIEEPA